MPRIVFTDLYLSGSSGKTAAAHTANVFKKVVATDTAPVLVVIWSKHTDERASEPGLPPDDQPTAATLFKDALLEAEPKFRERLIFTEMPASDVRSTTNPSSIVSISSRHVGFVKSTWVPSTARRVAPTPAGRGDGDGTLTTFGGVAAGTLFAGVGDGLEGVMVVEVLGMI